MTDASKAAAFVLEAGAAIVANDWQGRRIGRMVYEPDVPAAPRKAADQGQAVPAPAAEQEPEPRSCPAWSTSATSW